MICFGHLVTVTAAILLFWRSGHLRTEFVGPVWASFARGLSTVDIIVAFVYYELAGPGLVFDPLGRHPGGGRRLVAHHRHREYAWARVLEISVRPLG